MIYPNKPPAAAVWGSALRRCLATLTSTGDRDRLGLAQRDTQCPPSKSRLYSQVSSASHLSPHVSKVQVRGLTPAWQLQTTKPGDKSERFLSVSKVNSSALQQSSDHKNLTVQPQKILLGRKMVCLGLFFWIHEILNTTKTQRVLQ